MIFEKRRSYSTVLFIPREYFGLKNFKLNANKSNYPAKNYFIVMIFQNRRSYQLFYLFLDLILCQFWNEHPHSVSYQSDQAPVDVYFFPQMYFNFREKRTFRFHPLESMNRVITGRKLNTFARFAFQRYYV